MVKTLTVLRASVTDISLENIELLNPFFFNEGR